MNKNTNFLTTFTNALDTFVYMIAQKWIHCFVMFFISENVFGLANRSVLI